MLSLTLASIPRLLSFMTGIQGIDRMAADVSHFTKQEICVIIQLLDSDQ